MAKADKAVVCVSVYMPVMFQVGSAWMRNVEVRWEKTWVEFECRLSLLCSASLLKCYHLTSSVILSLCHFADTCTCLSKANITSCNFEFGNYKKESWVLHWHWAWLSVGEISVPRKLFLRPVDNQATLFACDIVAFSSQSSLIAAHLLLK